MQFDRNSSRFYLVENDTKFSSPVFHWTKPIPCFQITLCFNFFPVFGIRNSQKYHLCFFFFDSPLLPLVTSLPKFSKNYSGSPRQAISLLTNWFEEPIELQDLFHIVDGRCQLYGNHRYCGVL